MAPLNQTATIWTATPNGFGGYTFAAPVTTPARWEDRSELIPETSEVSRGVVFLGVDVSPEDYLYQGTSAALTPPGDAIRVRGFKKTPDLRNLRALRKVWF